MKSKAFLVIGLTMAALLLYSFASSGAPPSAQLHKHGIAKASHLVAVDAAITMKADVSADEVVVAPAQAEVVKAITIAKDLAGVTVLTIRHECDVSPPKREARVSHGPPLRC